MKFGYTIVYVPNVEESLRFFEEAFDISIGFVHESGTYGELSTGETVLAFASHALARQNFEQAYIEAHDSSLPLGIEIGLVTEEVERTHKKALSHGAKEIAAPKEKPWGQIVSYLRTPDGTLIELCSPVKQAR